MSMLQQKFIDNTNLQKTIHNLISKTQQNYQQALLDLVNISKTFQNYWQIAQEKHSLNSTQKHNILEYFPILKNENKELSFLTPNEKWQTFPIESKTHFIVNIKAYNNHEYSLHFQFSLPKIIIEDIETGADDNAKKAIIEYYLNNKVQEELNK